MSKKKGKIPIQPVSGTKVPRFAGSSTFARLPELRDVTKCDVAIVGVPFDGGVTNRTGARHGPREIRNQSSLMRKTNQASGIDPYSMCQVADIGDAWVQSPFNLESALGDVALVVAQIEELLVPVTSDIDPVTTAMKLFAE